MFMVLALHLHVYMPIRQSIPHYIYGFCGIAIPLFFMVSGFLMAKKTSNLQYVIRKTGGVIRFVFFTISIEIVVEWLLGNGVNLKTYGSWIIQNGRFWHYWYFAALLLLYAMLPFLGKIMRSNFLLLFIAVMTTICFSFFIIDIICDFENRYIRQPFRIWYWLLYFMVGAYIGRNEAKFHRIPFGIVAIAAIVFVTFYLSGVTGLKRNEFYFGSLLCLIYTVSLFVYLLKLSIENKYLKKTISSLSEIFLPVYAIHPFFIKYALAYIPTLSDSPQLTIGYYYLLVSVSVVLLSLLFIKIPIFKEIFKL